MNFNQWFDTYLEEKGIKESSKVYEIDVNDTWNHIPIQVVYEYLMSADLEQKRLIKDKIVQIDFVNGDVFKFFEHIAEYIALGR